MFLWTHYGAMRGNNIREGELPDLFIVQVDEQGPTRCIALVLGMRAGKMNALGKLEYAAMIRAKLAELCGIGALAIYFYERFDLGGEDPDICDAASWYFTKIFPGKEITKQISATTHSRSMKKV